jgi:hypothetical protein
VTLDTAFSTEFPMTIIYDEKGVSFVRYNRDRKTIMQELDFETLTSFVNFIAASRNLLFIVGSVLPWQAKYIEELLTRLHLAPLDFARDLFEKLCTDGSNEMFQFSRFLLHEYDGKVSEVLVYTFIKTHIKLIEIYFWLSKLLMRIPIIESLNT